MKTFIAIITLAISALFAPIASAQIAIGNGYPRLVNPATPCTVEVGEAVIVRLNTVTALFVMGDRGLTLAYRFGSGDAWARAAYGSTDMATAAYYAARDMLVACERSLKK